MSLCGSGIFGRGSCLGTVRSKWSAIATAENFAETEWAAIGDAAPGAGLAMMLVGSMQGTQVGRIRGRLCGRRLRLCG